MCDKNSRIYDTSYVATRDTPVKKEFSLKHHFTENL